MRKLAIRWFGAYFRDHRAEFTRLHDKLIQADMRVSVEEWLSTITMYSFITALAFLPLYIIASKFVFGYFIIWNSLSNIFHGSLGGLLPLVGELLLLPLGTLAPFLLCFFLMYPYPSIRIWERRRKIDGHLPYAIGWMSSLATVGVIPFEIFKKLAETEEFYGEVSREAARLVRDVEVLGFDFITAIRNLATITPSEALRTFLQGAMTSALSGGEMGSYFVNKARENMEDNRKKFADYIATLGILSELYITGLVAGPLFIIVMFSAMMLLSGASPQLLMIIIYGIIPLGSLLFILLTDSMTPVGMK
ncbi:MAG: type II secretion system F family protein [Chloroflexi bacterium]|nr:type II secretion system F family protein [Chloroflexota bacterium]